MSLVDLGKRLLESAKLGNTEDVRTLMSNGAPFTTDWLGTSPLHFAAQNGHLTTVETLLRAGISRDARTKVDRTPLHVASQEGHMNIASLLLDNQADVDAKDMLKMTPLHWASEKGHIDVIELLLRYGADVNCIDKFDRTPIDIPFANGRADIAQLLQLAPGAKSVEGVSMNLPMPYDHSHENVIDETEIIETELIDATNSIDTNNTGLHATVVEHIPQGVPVKVVENFANNNEVTVESVDICTTSQEELSSTSVLTTLAALAEATTKPSNSTKTSEALNWLENHGITMISQDDSIVASAVESGQSIAITGIYKNHGITMISQDDSIVASAVESGQSIAISEAGQVAIDLIKEQSNSGVVVMEEDVISSNPSDDHLVISQEEMMSSGDVMSSDVEVMLDVDGETVTIVTEQGDIISSDTGLIEIVNETVVDEEIAPPTPKRSRRLSAREGYVAR